MRRFFALTAIAAVLPFSIDADVPTSAVQNRKKESVQDELRRTTRATPNMVGPEYDKDGSCTLRNAGGGPIQGFTIVSKDITVRGVTAREGDVILKAKDGTMAIADRNLNGTYVDADGNATSFDRNKSDQETEKLRNILKGKRLKQPLEFSPGVIVALGAMPLIPTLARTCNAFKPK